MWGCARQRRLALLFILTLSCTGQGGEPRVAASRAALEEADAGNCVAVDAIDSLPDLRDEDCDGVVDEDADFYPNQCPIGSNVIEGTASADVLTGTTASDCILGYGGNDLLQGLDGHDLLAGGPGGDRLEGGDGKDTILGGVGDDTLLGGTGKDWLEGGPGNDSLAGENGVDYANGGACHDTITGDNGGDTLRGGDGADRVIGGHAPNDVDGEGGTDSCAGRNCELPDTVPTCISDAGCAAGTRCVVATGICADPSVISFEDTTCDDLDDDCDGSIDDDYVTPTTTCGVGTCAAAGSLVCDRGATRDTCVPGAPEAADERCDFMDEDCDGVSDEGYVSLATNCGVGACAATGATSCVAGQALDSCVPGTPAPSDTGCDGIDDDCDGTSDEGYVSLATLCGVGACAAAGITSCVAGQVHDSCTSGLPTPDTTCDLVDDDCDGPVDEGYVPLATSCGVGACAATGATSCADGVVLDGCVGGVPEDDADCDGMDDDCDGAFDDDYPFTCSAACLPVDLVASRAYAPATVIDDWEVFGAPQALAIPLRVPVVVGAAGTGTLTLSFQPPGGIEELCSYRGDGGVPGTYVFEGCTNALAAGDSIAPLWIRLTVEGGDQAAGETTVRMLLETCGGRFGLPEGVPIPADLEYALNTEVGLETGVHHVIVVLRPGATWEEMRDVLIGVGGRVVAAMPSIGVAVVGFDPAINFDGLGAAIEALDAEAIIEAASHDFVLEGARVPKASVLSDYDWTRVARGSHWGLRYIRAPVAWNLLDPIREALLKVAPGPAVPADVVEVAVIDLGFTKHTDLTSSGAIDPVYDPLRTLGADEPVFRLQEGDFRPPSVAAHGTFVAGLVGAGWSSRFATDGVSPFVRISGFAPPDLPTAPPPDKSTVAETLASIVSATAERAATQERPARVVNLSLQMPFGCPKLGETSPFISVCDSRESGRLPASGVTGAGVPFANRCSSDEDAANAREEIFRAGDTFASAVANVVANEAKDPLFVVAAGNQSGPFNCGLGDFPAYLASPFANAALRRSASRRDVGNNVVVVEALGIKSDVVRRAEYSNAVVSDDTGPQPDDPLSAPTEPFSILAPGSDLRSLVFGCDEDESDPNCGPNVTDQSDTKVASGTSGAAPMVSGAAAYLLAACPGLTNDELRRFLVDEGERFQTSTLVPGTRTRAKLDLATSLRALANALAREAAGEVSGDLRTRCKLPDLDLAWADMNVTVHGRC